MTAEVARTRGKIHALQHLAELGRDYKLAIVPVTGLLPSDKYQLSVREAHKQDGHNHR